MNIKNKVKFCDEKKSDSYLDISNESNFFYFLFIFYKNL